jgi:hypothetical protein
MALGRSDAVAYSNSITLERPALAALTDIFAMPTWLPFANVFSIGDVLIAAGVATTIVLAMRRTRGASPGVVEPGASLAT